MGSERNSSSSDLCSEKIRLNFQRRCDYKWRKLDLQKIFSVTELANLWNELVREKEIVFPNTEFPRRADACNNPGICFCWLCKVIEMQQQDESKQTKTEEEELDRIEVEACLKACIKTWSLDFDIGKNIDS
ncbi:E3 ubiquitin-protein ligase HERC2-like [Uloborus diversus]|uniref:E3 ubiquitin-protein ligase HERC2-like n=1 Tax=Uloborus diversus TaxID=327109 RepID=UPI00240A6B66|nr:E3 ubiquitin-protein ligase HERC2-like [Uloborus diversus]